jgi:hypothetical protein
MSTSRNISKRETAGSGGKARSVDTCNIPDNLAAIEVKTCKSCGTILTLETARENRPGSGTFRSKCKKCESLDRQQRRDATRSTMSLNGETSDKPGERSKKQRIKYSFSAKAGRIVQRLMCRCPTCGGKVNDDANIIYCPDCKTSIAPCSLCRDILLKIQSMGWLHYVSCHRCGKPIGTCTYECSTHGPVQKPAMSYEDFTCDCGGFVKYDEHDDLVCDNCGITFTGDITVKGDDHGYVPWVRNHVNYLKIEDPEGRDPEEDSGAFDRIFARFFSKEEIRSSKPSKQRSEEDQSEALTAIEELEDSEDNPEDAAILEDLIKAEDDFDEGEVNLDETNLIGNQLSDDLEKERQPVLDVLQQPLRKKADWWDRKTLPPTEVIRWEHRGSEYTLWDSVLIEYVDDIAEKIVCRMMDLKISGQMNALEREFDRQTRGIRKKVAKEAKRIEKERRKAERERIKTEREAAKVARRIEKQQAKEEIGAEKRRKAGSKKKPVGATSLSPQAAMT